MNKEAISTNQAPAALGPYSQGIIASGEMIFVSGQVPIDPQTGNVVEDDAAVQAKRSMDNIAAVLKEAGATMENIVKTTIFLKDINDFAAVNAVYEKYFENAAPARSCVQVACLPKDVRLEIEAIAVR